MALTQTEIVDIIQRFIGKRMTGKYQFPREIVLAIRDETGINATMVDAVLVQNGYLPR